MFRYVLLQTVNIRIILLSISIVSLVVWKYLSRCSWYAQSNSSVELRFIEKISEYEELYEVVLYIENE